nr:hypothetical protein Itr_chr12CG09350 [Ipomoea trifida]
MHGSTFFDVTNWTCILNFHSSQIKERRRNRIFIVALQRKLCHLGGTLASKFYSNWQIRWRWGKFVNESSISILNRVKIK